MSSIVVRQTQNFLTNNMQHGLGKGGKVSLARARGINFISCERFYAKGGEPLAPKLRKGCKK
jgi:hypothetical protein